MEIGKHITRKELYQIGATFFATISVWVAAPIIAALFLGKWLDEKLHTAPWLMLGLILLAFAASNIGIYKESKKLLTKLEKTKITKSTTEQTDGNHTQN